MHICISSCPIAYLKTPEGMFYLNSISNIHIRYTHTRIHFILRMLYALTLRALWQYIQTVFSFVMLKTGKGGGGVATMII